MWSVIRTDRVSIFMRKWKRRINRFIQRRTRGWDDSELWDLDYTIAKFVYPRLVQFRNHEVRYHASIEEATEYANEMQKMIETFRFLSSEERCDFHDKEKWDEVQKGLELFAKHFTTLWL